MSDCGCTICVWTPARIFDLVEHDDGTPVDCFADAVPGDNPYREKLIRRLWSMYRYSMIDSICLDRWLQRVKDQAEIIDGRYRLLCSEWESRQGDLASIDMGWSETYEDHSTQAPTGSDTVVRKSEDIPQTAGAASSEWLSRRDTDTSTPGVTVKTDADGNRKHVSNDMLNAEEFGRVEKALRSPYTMYAKEFEKLFANYWAMDGGCNCRRGRSRFCACLAA